MPALRLRGYCNPLPGILGNQGVDIRGERLAPPPCPLAAAGEKINFKCDAGSFNSSAGFSYGRRRVFFYCFHTFKSCEPLYEVKTQLLFRNNQLTSIYENHY